MNATEAPQLIAERYRIVARIGSGGMGEVYRARDETLERTVAVKVLPPSLAARPGFVERFRAEAQAAARVSHASVVQVYDWGSDAGSYFMVMEYVRGRTLRDMLAAHERLAPAQAATVIDQVLAGLEAAHASGLVHRDVKPENILVTLSGEVKVTDFGIATLAEGGHTSANMVGTASYVAPEQIRGETVDGRADLYAAGCVLYELLCGAPPFEGNAAYVLDRHVNADVPPPSIEVLEAAPFDRVVAKATRRDPAERYATAAGMRADLMDAAAKVDDAPPLKELSAELTSVVAPDGVPAANQTMVAAARKHHRKWPWVVTAVLVALAVAAALFVRPLPKVAGLSQSAALSKLHQAGLHATVHQAFSDATVGTVIGARSSVISLGSFGLRGGKVVLTVSKGPDLVAVPAVQGNQVDQAEQALRSGGFGFKVNYVNDSSVSGTVIAQFPQPPNQVAPGTAFSLTVSKGPQLVAVPAVTGTATTYAQAVSALQAAHLTATQQQAYSTSTASGVVMGESPASGSLVPINSQVALTVSRGAPPFAMPPVTTQQCPAAQAQLQGDGLQVTVVNTSGGTGCTGPVLEQDPVAGVSVQKGQTATLYVH
ncbi:MAG TPA: PASTA domain-containing protein [Actinomycetota bacterium]|nr:PASTA domain-containing protein [Actinomycetota bacterium]